MSDPIVLMERYAAFKMRADRLQAAMDAIAKAEPDVEMCAMADSLKVKRDRILLDCASIQLEMANLLNDMKGGNRMCIYEICPMMTGGEWPDCKTCPYADGTEGDERMRTHYLYDIERILGTFEAIKEHEGKNATGIAKGVGYQAVIGRINEFKDKGLVRTYSLHRDIYLTPKG